MVRLALGVVGGAIGAFFGGPVGFRTFSAFEFDDFSLFAGHSLLQKNNEGKNS